MNKVKGLGPLALGAWIGASAIVSGCVGEVGDGVLDPTAMAGLGDDSPYDPADPSAPTGSTPAPADGGVANVPDSGTGTAMNPGADAGADSGTNPPMDPYVPVDDANIIVAVGDRQLRTSYAPGSAANTTDVAATYSDYTVLRDVDCGGGKCIAVGEFMYTTTDGKSWTGGVHGYGWFGGIAYGDGAWVGAGSNLAASRSDDGVNWDPNMQGTMKSALGFAGGQSGHFRGVGFGNGVFVAVGHGGDNQNGIILYSTDKGVTWKSPDVLPADAGLLNVGYGPFGFVAVGWGGRRVRSTDGRVWTDDTRSLTNENVTGVVYGDGLYVAASNAGILTSPDGAEPWTYYPYPNGSGLSQVAYMDGKFYVAKGGVLWSTVDFVSYTKLATAPAGYRAIVSGKLN